MNQVQLPKGFGFEHLRGEDFEELPGHPYRLFLSTRRLDAMMQAD